MRNLLQQKLNTGLALTIPTFRLDLAWRPFQSSIVRSFVRRQRREALRARLLERALLGGTNHNE
jgi:hypothetical protein